MDKLLKELTKKHIDKIHIEQYVEKIAENIEKDTDLNDLNLYQLLSEFTNQEESTIRKKITRTINNSEEIIKNELDIDEKPTPKKFLGWIIQKVKK